MQWPIFVGIHEITHKFNQNLFITMFKQILFTLNKF